MNITRPNRYSTAHTHSLILDRSIHCSVFNYFLSYFNSKMDIYSFIWLVYFSDFLQSLKDVFQIDGFNVSQECLWYTIINTIITSNNNDSHNDS